MFFYLFILCSIALQATYSQEQPAFQKCSLLPEHSCGFCRCMDDNRLPTKQYCDCRYLEPEVDCYAHLKKGSKMDGIYRIKVEEFGTVDVFCDQTKDEGGWAVIQRRVDGSVDFYQNWETYKNGFGDMQHEFWAGNEKLHQMLKHEISPFGTTVHFELESWDGKRRFAEYETIKVESEEEQYKLTLGRYDGDAGDRGWGMSYHSGHQFVTFDKNSAYGISEKINCADERKGGWWYNNCATVNINGRYFYYNKNVTPWVGMIWLPFNGHQKSLKSTVMKIKRIPFNINKDTEYTRPKAPFFRKEESYA